MGFSRLKKGAFQGKQSIRWRKKEKIPHALNFSTLSGIVERLALKVS